MGGYIGTGGAMHTAENTSQADLVDRWEVDYADTVFTAMMGQSFKPFIETISEVFSPPRSIGTHFYFKPGKMHEFAMLMDSKSVAPPNSGVLAMRGTGTMVPDDPSPDPSATWRRVSAANGIGASFRQGGTNTSLHVAYNQASCDVHVDRNGFIIRDENGNVTWDLNALLRHVTVDLAGDKANWALLSLGLLDEKQRPIIQATLSPWTAVDLPSKENGGQLDLKLGLMVGGKFDENAVIDYIRRRRH